MSELRKVGILGAGMMGAEIALCFSLTGVEVCLKEVSFDLAKKGKERLNKILEKAISKGKLDEEKKETALSLIEPTDKYDAFRDADLVVEAITEDIEIKKMAFETIDPICKPNCVFATNTSSIPITMLASYVTEQRRPRFLGAHFFSPASVMKLVEIIPALETDEQQVELMMDWCRAIGKTPIRVKDVAGFAVNRILHALAIEAMRLVEEDVASIEDIDLACKLGLGHPIGPFTLMDLASNTLTLRVQEILFESYGERFRPPPILKQKVYANHLGRITGRGWYVY